MPFNPAILLGPGIILLFALAFVGTWALSRERWYLLPVAAAYLLFLLGTLVQVFSWPSGNANIMASNILYAGSAIALAEGMMGRVGQRSWWLFNAATFVLIVALVAWFTYGDRSLAARVHVHNLGVGGILLAGAIRMTGLLHGRLPGKILFWTYAVLAIHYFPRTALTMAVPLPSGGELLAHTVLWTVLHTSVAVMGIATAFAILYDAASNIIEDIRRRRGLDTLTGLGSLAIFERDGTRLLSVNNHPIALIRADLDEFQAFRQAVGPDVANAALMSSAELLSAHIRQSDLLARMGEADFVGLLRGCDGRQAESLARRIGQEAARLSGKLGATILPVLNCAAIEVRPDETLVQALARADEALSARRRRSRNSAIIAGLMPHAPDDDIEFRF